MYRKTIEFKKYFYRKEFREFCKELIKSRTSNFLNLPSSSKYISKKFKGNKEHYIWLCKFTHTLLRHIGNNPDNIYDRLCNIQIRHFIKLIGVGYHGLVFDIGDGKVIKIIYEQGDQEHSDFILYCMRSLHDETFPKIYRYSSGRYIVMEKLNTHTKLCKYYYNISIHQFYKIPIVMWVHIAKSWFGSNQCIPFIANDEEIWFWLLHIHEIFDGLDIDYPGDWCLDNIGQRPGTNEIVYMDP